MRKKIALLLLLTVVFLHGCGRTPSTAPPAPPTEKVFRWISFGEDSTVNPHDSGALPNYEIVDLIQVSLYDWAPGPSRDKAVLIPCLAAEEPVTQDGYTWSIKINPDAKWSNGEAITAETFLYSWKMGLDPKLAYTHGSSIASQYITVENALEYYGQMAEGAPAVKWEDVGFKAIDAYTLEITATQKYTPAQVMRHLAFRTTSPVYEPLYEAGMNADRTSTSYGSQLEQYLSCGPFTLTSWVKGSQRTLERNPNFINQDMIHIDRITCRVVADEATRVQLFEQGESDYVALGPAGLAKYAENPSLRSYDQKTVRTLEVNRSNPDHGILTDPNFRKALYHAIDREKIASLVNATPAPYFLSTWGVSFADGTLYRQMPEANAWLPASSGYDPLLARQLFDDAMTTWGLDSLALSLTYTGDMDSLRTASEFLQSQLAQIFGEDRFSLSLQAMQHTALLDLMRSSVAGETTAWDLCWSGWSLAAENFEPHKKFAPYRSSAANRYTNYSNAFLDEHYPLLLTEEYRMDEQASFDLTVELEKSMILEDATCIPVFQDKNYVLFSPRVQLTVDQFVGSLGYGWEYADIINTDQ